MTVRGSEQQKLPNPGSWTSTRGIRGTRRRGIGYGSVRYILKVPKALFALKMRVTQKIQKTFFIT